MSACEAFWLMPRCTRTARKVAVFENVFKFEQRLWLCDDHAEQFKDLEFRKQLLDRALDSLGALQRAGFKTPVQDMLHHPAQLALIAHQTTCEHCAAVRDWVTAQQLKSPAQDQAGIDRIGRYIVEHCCEEGVELNYQVGLAMQGGKK